MLTQEGDNTCVVGVKGNFDDTQNGVKVIFGDDGLKGELEAKGFAFSSANSINIGRLLPQIVYYFYSYGQLLAAGDIAAGDAVNFVVPTGNFGNILAGYYAKLLGLPVHRLICASNANNVLTDFLSTGEYNRNRDFYKTMSPSMDILISSNLERLLMDLADNDTTVVAQLMASLTNQGDYTVSQAILDKIASTFRGGYADEGATAAAIKDMFEKEGYLMDQGPPPLPLRICLKKRATSWILTRPWPARSMTITWLKPETTPQRWSSPPPAPINLATASTRASLGTFPRAWMTTPF